MCNRPTLSMAKTMYVQFSASYMLTKPTVPVRDRHQSGQYSQGDVTQAYRRHSTFLHWFTDNKVTVTRGDGRAERSMCDGRDRSGTLQASGSCGPLKVRLQLADKFAENRDQFG